MLSNPRFRKLRRILKSMAKTYSTAFVITLLPKLIQLGLLQKIPNLKSMIFGHFKAPIPLFLIKLFGGYQILELLGLSILESKRISTQNNELHPKLKMFVTKTSAFIGSLVAFYGLPQNMKMDFTLFALVRALDHASIGNPIQRFSAPLFHLSSWIIMYCWFYYPDALSPKYNLWISKIANLDNDLLGELRLIKAGMSTYGFNQPLPNLLKAVVERTGDSAVDGASMICPLPCKYAHGGIKSCTMHTISVFIRGFKDGMLVIHCNA